MGVCTEAVFIMTVSEIFLMKITKVYFPSEAAVIYSRPLGPGMQHSHTLIKDRNNLQNLNMLPEVKELITSLEQLSFEERKKALFMNPEVLIWKIRDEIDCMGCSSSLQSYIKDLAVEVANKGKSLNLEGLLVLPNAEISITF